ncbi:unnamed protein product [Urochloa decumbens]|uniref:C2H2-type domain-containing protein n=1 Tax=Urochloa decumbens TaxID=240449 RepID=A0ABC9AZE1_9POAL
MAAFLGSLLGIDFGLRCAAARSFCGVCREPACVFCCPHHAACHHPDVGDGHRRIIDVHLLQNQFPAVTAHGVKTTRIGYSWNRIERFEYEGSSWVMLGRGRPRRSGRYQGNCNPCGATIQVRSQHCCADCKVAAVQQGQGRQIVQRLVSIDFTRAHLFDSFCTACERPFSSRFCTDHTRHHADGENFQVLNVHSQDGWFLIPENQLPAAITQGIRRVEMDNGTLAVPIRARMFPNPNGEANMCSRPGCEEAVDVAGEICSLQCWTVLQV